MTLSGETLFGVGLKWKFKRGPPGFQLALDYKLRQRLQQLAFDCAPFARLCVRFQGLLKEWKQACVVRSCQCSGDLWETLVTAQHWWLNQGTNKGDFMRTGTEEAIPVPTREKLAQEEEQHG